MAEFDFAELAMLRALGDSYSNIEHTVAEIAALEAKLTLPKPVVHVISDIHGEYKKLRHVINNASGRLRPMVERLIESSEQHELLKVLYYPREMMEYLRPQLADRSYRRQWVRRILRHQFKIVRELNSGYRRNDVTNLILPEWTELFDELRHHTRGEQYLQAMLDALAEYDRDLSAVRAASHLVRNLSTAEIVVAGDLGDRGERIDHVIDYLMRQPNVSIVCGNHDASWMGACLGQEACIATVLRFSVRYGRLAQLEEGYGISLVPLEELAREFYSDDPAERFVVKGAPIELARMQKAIAILQLKLEAQTILRHPKWQMDDRNLLQQIDPKDWSVLIGDKRYPLLDRQFPTIDWNDPTALSAAERRCIDQLKSSFITSTALWQQMSWVARRGTMWERRDDALIFHACVPVDDRGEPIPVEIDGKHLAGRELFDALSSLIHRAYRAGASGAGDDADWFWYLWGAPDSPLFGKDKLATFEGYFIANKSAQEERKNPYFQMIHDADFVRKIGKMFGMNDDVLLVNGHVPVKIEQGEEPVKRGGNAVTIDGAFSEAYGDKGYSLLLEPERIALAEHSHFDSVQQVIESDADIVPKVREIRSYPTPRPLNDTEVGKEIREKIRDLKRLIQAYQEGQLHEKS